MSSIIIAIERTKDQGFEDLMVNQITDLLSNLNYKKTGEIEEGIDNCHLLDRRLRYRPMMYGEQS